MWGNILSKWEWHCIKMLINNITADWFREWLKDHPLGCNGFFNIVPSAFRAWHIMGT